MSTLGERCIVWVLFMIYCIAPNLASAAGENQQQIPAEASEQNPAGVGEPPALENADESVDPSLEEVSDLSTQININYFGIFFGPSIQGTSSFQPAASGEPDRDRPIILKNFLNIGRDLSEMVTVTATAFWVAQPVMNKSIELQDPFVRASYNSIYSWRGLNLYGDVRAHFPVTTGSQQSELKFGAQAFQALTYGQPDSRFLFGLYASQRRNFFGVDGYGNDVELYIAPNINYQFAPTLTATFLFELQRNHIYGDPNNGFQNDGTDIEPGVSWEITPQIMVNPYLHILIGPPISLRNTSLGMMMSWTLL